LINLDSKSLIGVLVWGNFVMGIVIYLYEKTSKYKFNFHSLLHNMITIRFLSMFGYLCLFSRDSFPDILSVNIGNTVLFITHFLDAGMLLKIIGDYNKKIARINSIILVSCVLIFNIFEMMYHNASLRIGIASISIFFIFLPAAISLLLSKQKSNFKKSIGFIFIPLLLALIPRSIEGIRGRLENLGVNVYFQTLLFGSLVLLMILITIVYLLFMKEQSDSIIEKMANYDKLTDVMNRHHFFGAGNEIFVNSRKNKLELSLLFLDIDYFKKINDNYGHQFGDEVLVRFADMIKHTIRPLDICCRYGGEEFIILANVKADVCKTMAERILAETEHIRIDSQPDFHMTTSIGTISAIPHLDETLEDFINKADKAMYIAKQSGRNKIVVSKEHLG
jgi:diguanylate cyclase (GGDEF)-like protein